ncbi:SDR family NAD(P)-dependent oxidoreductase [Tropicimonas sp. IMCC6043]|uniref:SDR family NAD(P)-dependent oxidoreductase n=1 Tax=Tropicimonas sp. IMCC6043 TaxID=2510645 RepID=UPI00101C0C48|nr:SDR family NAD(P)-dependent oxidoreductase [Tropicimonas sp. IMCC6043]RYH07657.1 SDR family NAD(P)-dependent oxidoreductase [Tropicimonas sp. IMCC6043]
MTRAALVTGGNRGIGRAIAAGLVARGVKVTITARDRAEGAEAAEALGCDWALADLLESDSLRQFDGAPFDILVNNAGILPSGSLLDNPQGYFDCMAVMVDGPFRLTLALAPGMIARGYGRIVNLSSGWGAFAEGLGGPNGYGIAKAALNAQTLALSQELPGNVKINAMCPGWVRTRMGGPGANTSPEDAADTAIWLATLPADGPTGGFVRRRRRIDW